MDKSTSGTTVEMSLLTPTTQYPFGMGGRLVIEAGLVGYSQVSVPRKGEYT
jgi:hypothetical protein